MKLRLLVCVCLWLGAIARPGKATADVPLADSYEGRALARALTELKLEIEPAPEGKTLDRIWVSNFDVFGPRDRFLQIFNVFHRTTRWRQVEREVILRPGEPWNERKIWETERKLRDPIFTSLVVIVPVKTTSPERVDLLVVTRDVWSLRMNSNLEVQSGKLTQLTLSISENNFLGRRKQLAMVFNMDQSEFFVGPLYVDKNIAGTRLRLTTNGGPLFGRESGKLEGSRSRTVFSYPFWSIDSQWGAALSVRHFDAIVREFFGTELRTYDVPETAETEAVEWEYRFRNIDVTSSVSRSYGRKVVQRATLGYQLEVSRPDLLRNFSQSDSVRDAFKRDIFPRSERTSSVFARYNLFTPRYTAYRNVATFELSEDARLGPDVSATAGTSLRLLGSETNFAFGSLSAGYTQDLAGDGFVRVVGSGSTRVQGRDLIDNRVDFGARVVTPTVAGFGRFAARFSVAARIDEQQNRFLVVGGSSGLRGYQIGAFLGQKRVLMNAEFRTRPISLWFNRTGAIFFWDAGHAADRFSEIGLRQDIGIGLRFLTPQLSPLPYRLDWAIPLNGPSKGLPGRFIFGVDQVF